MEQPPLPLPAEAVLLHWQVLRPIIAVAVDLDWLREVRAADRRVIIRDSVDRRLRQLEAKPSVPTDPRAMPVVVPHGPAGQPSAPTSGPAPPLFLEPGAAAAPRHEAPESPELSPRARRRASGEPPRRGRPERSTVAEALDVLKRVNEVLDLPEEQQPRTVEELRDAVAERAAPPVPKPAGTIRPAPGWLQKV